MEFQILGPLRVVDDGSELVLGATSLRRLVARLAVAAPDVVSADRLAEDLGLSEGALRTTISRLRKIVGDSVATEAPGYAIRNGEVDATRFQTGVRDALDAEPKDRVVLCDEALMLWRGAALAEFADEEWARPPAAHLEELRALAREARVQAKLDLGRNSEVVSELGVMMGDYPFRDEPRRQMMVALAAAGRQTEALRCFQDYRQLLADEVGTEPGPALWELDAEIASVEAGSIDAPSRRRSNLPAQRSSFFGRQRELTAIADALTTRQVVTLTGVGGVGKTRLALQAAAEASPLFSDGVWFCELAAAIDLDGVCEIVATTLGVQQQQSSDLIHSIAESLHGTQTLLLLDNCEHLLDETAELVDCVTVGDSVVVLATSREGLAVEGEQIIPVPSLALPAADTDETEAVQLFVDRAAALVEGFELNADNRGAVATICRRLDGIPLAIELAAARAPAMTPDEVVDHLDERFRLLTGGRRRSRERHQTLRQTIDWSYDLLDEQAQATMRRLAVFGGSFDLAAAEAVTSDLDLDHGAVLDIVIDLVRKSLLMAEPIGSQTRYRYLETIRQYSEEQLEAATELDGTNRLAAKHMAAWIRTAVENLVGPDEAEWVNKLRLELPNLRRVVDWTIDADEPDTAMAVLAPLQVCLNGPGDFVARLAANVIETFPAIDSPDLPAVMTLAAHEYLLRGEYDKAISLSEVAVEGSLAMGNAPLASSYNQRAMAQAFAGDVDSAVDTMWRSVEVARETGDDVNEVMSLVGFVGWSRSTHRIDTAGALALADELWEQASAMRYPTALASVKWTYGFVLTEESPELALEHYLEGLEIESMDSMVSDALATGAAVAAVQGGDPARAIGLIAPHLERWEREGNRVMIDYFLLAVAKAAHQIGEFVIAAHLLGYRSSIWALQPEIHDELHAGLVSELGADRLRQFESEGEAMSFEEATAILHQYLDEHHPGTV